MEKLAIVIAALALVASAATVWLTFFTRKPKVAVWIVSEVKGPIAERNREFGTSWKVAISNVGRIPVLVTDSLIHVRAPEASHPMGSWYSQPSQFEPINLAVNDVEIFRLSLSEDQESLAQDTSDKRLVGVYLHLITAAGGARVIIPIDQQRREEGMAVVIDDFDKRTINYADNEALSGHTF